MGGRGGICGGVELLLRVDCDAWLDGCELSADSDALLGSLCDECLPLKCLDFKMCDLHPPSAKGTIELAIGKGRGSYSAMLLLFVQCFFCNLHGRGLLSAGNW